MRSCLKIIGPPIAKALAALVKIADASPLVTINPYLPSTSIAAFREDVPSPPQKFRTTKHIISAAIVIGDCNLVFEWARTPTPKELENFLAKIDDALRPLNCNYTIETK